MYVVRRRTYKRRFPEVVDGLHFESFDVDGEDDVVLDVLEYQVVADDAHVVDDTTYQALDVACRCLQLLPATHTM